MKKTINLILLGINLFFILQCKFFQNFDDKADIIIKSHYYSGTVCKISGTVRNNGSDDATSVSVIAKYYNSSGTLLETTSSGNVLDLSVGEESTFSVWFHWDLYPGTPYRYVLSTSWRETAAGSTVTRGNNDIASGYCY